MQSALKPLAAAVLLTCVSSVATADSGPFSQFIVFGDSLSDAGNFPDLQSPTLGGTTGVAPPHRPHPDIGEVGTQRLAACCSPAIHTAAGAADGTPNQLCSGRLPYRSILDSINGDSIGRP